MTFLLVLFGFMALASGTWRQSATIFGQIPPPRRRFALLAGGYGLLAWSLALVLADDDLSRALVGWFGKLTMSAMLALLGCWLWRRKRT